MIELLQRAAALGADRPAIIGDGRAVDYPQLADLAVRTARRLRERGVERFGIVDHDPVTVVALLAASSAVGAEACVYPPLGAPDEVTALAARLDHDVLVSERSDLAGSVIRPGELAGTNPAAAAEPPPARPLLVLTTGTTGVPRAARQDWNRLLRRVRSTEPAPDQRWLLAYGLHQYGGLQILLHVMASGATLVAPTPRVPRVGLAAMRAHDVQYASATPTYWRFLLAELHADGGPSPDLRQITLGGEAVPGPLLSRLAAAFPRAHVSQVYAANEAGSLSSVRDGRNGLPLSVLDDRPDADVQLKIVDGELWARSRVGMLGYYGEEPIDPDAWRATGDLVEVVGDRIQFRGRTSEVINVGGVKVHPLPIEERIGALPGIDMARVYGRPNALTGAIVAVEVVAAPDADRDALRDAVRGACDDLPAAARPRSVRFVDDIVTRGSKVIRR